MTYIRLLLAEFAVPASNRRVPLKSIEIPEVVVSKETRGGDVRGWRLRSREKLKMKENMDGD